MGKTTSEAVSVFDAFHTMVTEPDKDVDHELLEDLELLSGVSSYPARIKCAILAWHALKEAVEGDSGSISTE